MPVGKKNETAYGVLVGAMQNHGMSLAEAKKKTDKALKDNPNLGSKLGKKYGKKKPSASKKAPRSNKKGKK